MRFRVDKRPPFPLGHCAWIDGERVRVRFYTKTGDKYQQQTDTEVVFERPREVRVVLPSIFQRLDSAMQDSLIEHFISELSKQAAKGRLSRADAEQLAGFKQLRAQREQQQRQAAPIPASNQASPPPSMSPRPAPTLPPTVRPAPPSPGTSRPSPPPPASSRPAVPASGLPPIQPPTRINSFEEFAAHPRGAQILSNVARLIGADDSAVALLMRLPALLNSFVPPVDKKPS